MEGVEEGAEEDSLEGAEAESEAEVESGCVFCWVEIDKEEADGCTSEEALTDKEEVTDGLALWRTLDGKAVEGERLSEGTEAGAGARAGDGAGDGDGDGDSEE